MPTLLALGAHYDDCVFGVPGLLLQAVRKHYRVVVVSVIGDYTNWKPVAGRADELVEGTQKICRDFGVEMRYLDAASMRFGVDEATKRALAAVVVDVKPDVALMLWPDDRHPDHEIASRLSKFALRGADRLVEAPGWRPPRRIYQYDNGPGHTIGFEPDTYVDVADDFPRAQEWLGRFMALVGNEPYRADMKHPALDTKRILSEYRGRACGARYAEALKGYKAYPREIL